MVPKNYAGPNAAGAPKTEVPYYAQGHALGAERLTDPGPNVQGGLPVPAPAAPATPAGNFWTDAQGNIITDSHGNRFTT